MGLRYFVSLSLPTSHCSTSSTQTLAMSYMGQPIFLLSLTTPFPESQLSPSHSHSYLIFLPNQWLIGRMLLLCPFHNVIPLLRGYLFWTVITKSRAHASLPCWRDMPPHIAWRKAVSLCRWSIHTAQTVASLLPHSRCQTIALLTPQFLQVLDQAWGVLLLLLRRRIEVPIHLR